LLTSLIPAGVLLMSENIALAFVALIFVDLADLLIRQVNKAR
jgi:hypothetical protein